MMSRSRAAQDDAVSLMSVEIRLEALQKHIRAALRREGLPPLHRRQFTKHLAKVDAALMEMRGVAVGSAK